MARTLVTLALLLSLSSSIVSAQQYYAVLITGDCPWWEGRTFNDSFWNDTFLMWEMLQKQGYDPENIHVIYYNGSDYQADNSRYRPPFGEVVTDASATLENVQSTFGLLASTMTENDVLFIWTFDHGISYGNNVSALQLNDGQTVSYLVDSDFADLVNAVPCKKRIIMMARCYSGGFIDNLASNKTVMLTACQGNEIAHTADNLMPNGLPGGDDDEQWENEPYGAGDLDTSYHSEFNYHVFHAMNYDINGDGDTSFDEVVSFEFDRDSWYHRQTPVYTPAFSGSAFLTATTFINCNMDLTASNMSLSSAAISGNNQRKLCREPSGKLHEVFESGGETFYRNSTSDGTTWQVTTRLSGESGG